LRLTAILGLVFLAIQTWNWAVLIRMHGGPTDGLYGFLFFFLTVMHAIHVIAGLAPLLVATGRARTGRYTREAHYGIRHLAIYWHFLGVMWLLLFGVLYLLDRP
jgi:cytochrome c oxidase subunit 3